MADSTRQGSSHLLACARIDASVPLSQLDVGWLRERFVQLCDRAAREVFRLGYDLDDVLLHRLLIVLASNGDTKDIPAEPLSDADALRAAVRHAAGEATLDALITEIRVDAVLDVPPGGLSLPLRSRAEPITLLCGQ